MFFAYVYIVLYIIVMLTLFFMGIEQVITVATNRAPAISAGRKKSDAVVKWIAVEMPNVKTVLDIGSGWGALVSSVNKKFPDAKITGMEIMPTPFIYSSIRCMFKKNVKIVFGDAFKILNKTDNVYDVGITYLLTPEMKDVEPFLSRFKVLLSVDFPLPNIKPVQKIKIYHDGRIQHWLYVYKK